MNPMICLVLVTYQAGTELEEVIARAQRSGARVLCVDNFSGDDTPDRAAAAGADVIRLQDNMGYGRAFNIALREAHEPVVVCSNQDLLVEDGSLAFLAAAVVGNADLIIAAPRLTDRCGRTAETAHLLPRFFRHQLELLYGGGGLRNAWPAHEAEWVSGAFLVARRGTWTALGGFSDDYWMYVEDVDLFFRLRRLGGRLHYEPCATVTHLGGRRPLSAQMHAQVLRNWGLYYRQHYGRTASIFASVSSVAGGLMRAAMYACRRGRNEDADAYEDMFFNGVLFFLAGRRRRP